MKISDFNLKSFQGSIVGCTNFIVTKAFRDPKHISPNMANSIVFLEKFLTGLTPVGLGLM